MKNLTPTQLFKLKELNNKFYTNISGKDKEGIIDNFDDFLKEYERTIQFFEQYNFFKNSMKMATFEKQMELSIKKPKSDKTQEELVLSYLQTGKTINPLQAIEYFSCFRLASVIHLLRNKGFKIKDVGLGKFSVYKLEEDGN